MRQHVRKLAGRIRNRIGALWWHSGLMFLSMRLGDVIQIYIGLFIVPDVISQERLGAVLPLMQLCQFAGLPLKILVQTGMKYISVFEAAGEHGRTKALFRDMLVALGAVSAVILLLAWALADVIQARLKLAEASTLWVAAGLAVVTCWRPMAQMTARGLKDFRSLILSGFVAPAVRLVAIVLLLEHFQLAGYLGASLIAQFAAVILLTSSLFAFFRSALAYQSYRKYVRGMVRYAVPSAVIAAVIVTQPMVEMWVIRQRLPVEDSAGFYMAGVLGRIPQYLGTAMLPFLFPMISERHEKRGPTTGLLVQSVVASMLVGGSLVVFFAIAADWLLGLRASWCEHIAYAPFVWQVALASTLGVAMKCFAVHENACRKFRYLAYFGPLLVGESLLLYVYMNWGFFLDWLPGSVWKTVDSLFERDLQFVISVMVGSRILVVVAMILQLLGRRLQHADMKDA